MFSDFDNDLYDDFGLGAYVQQTPQNNYNPQSQMPQNVNNMQSVVNGLKPQKMVNPIKITEPSYILTETQLKNLISLKQGQQLMLQSPQPQLQQCNIVEPITQPVVTNVKPKNNVLDTVGNATFGTVGRIGHTLTNLVDGVINICCLGYDRK